LDVVFEPQNIEQGITNVEGKLHDWTFLVQYSIFAFNKFKDFCFAVKS